MYTEELIDSLNRDIEKFPQVFPVTKDMKLIQEGVSRLVMLDRYSFKDITLKTLKNGDLVVFTIKDDPRFPARGIGYVLEIDREKKQAKILVEEEFRDKIEDKIERKTGLVKRPLNAIEKPLELFYEQIAMRNAKSLASMEKTKEKQEKWFKKFYHELKNMNFIPAGRVLYGAGAETNVTYFNCFVMPFMKDSREGISEHRKQVIEIMSRGGGVGTNGSTLRPRNALARGVNGKSSGAVSWLDDLAKLTHLVEQGGSRRGAQMIMLSVWHPDIIEFIISKMQNPEILRFLIEHFQDEIIQKCAKEKLKFSPLTPLEKEMYETILKYQDKKETNFFNDEIIKEAKRKLKDGGTYSVHNPDFLSGANISVAITHEFMEAVEKDLPFTLEFPDVENYDKKMMDIYNHTWHEIGDVRKWKQMGYKTKAYHTIQARELWDLINICATFSAEPGIFFIDTANDMTNAKSYGQKVVATNPCGEQPLAPYSVCNLSAINLSNMADFHTRKLNVEKLKQTVRIGVRLQDNIIDASPHFMEETKKQAYGERRIGMGVMGLHDLLIKCGIRYGSPEGNQLVDEIFRIIATTAYETSIELAKEKGSFPYLTGKTKQETMELRKKFIDTGFMKKMPESIRQDILKYGIRNSHLLTVAPTGSTGTLVGCSTGLEPYFAFKYYRNGRLGKNIEVTAKIVKDFLESFPDADPNHLPDYFVSAMELSPMEHVATQCTIQRWVDSSISKTVNAPKGYTVEQVKKIYESLYKGGAKGGTVYVDGSRDTQVLTLKKEEKPKKRKIGSDLGDICPICHEGTVIKSGGCHTCDTCHTQLKCGL